MHRYFWVFHYLSILLKGKKPQYSERTKRSMLQQGHGPGWCFTWKWKSSFPHLCTATVKSWPAVVLALKGVLHFLPNGSPSQKQFIRGNGVGWTKSLFQPPGASCQPWLCAYRPVRGSVFACACLQVQGVFSCP